METSTSTSPYPASKIDISELEDKINSALLAEIDAHPDILSDTHPYYLKRIDEVHRNGKAFRDWERALIRYIVENVPATTPILEVGAGISAFGCALSVCGYEVVAVERNAPSLRLASALVARLQPQISEANGRWACLDGDFPECLSNLDSQTGISDFLQVMMELTGSLPTLNFASILSGTFLSNEFIVDLKHFGCRRDIPADINCYSSYTLMWGNELANAVQSTRSDYRHYSNIALGKTFSTEDLTQNATMLNEPKKTDGGLWSIDLPSDLVGYIAYDLPVYRARFGLKHNGHRFGRHLANEEDVAKSKKPAYYINKDRIFVNLSADHIKEWPVGKWQVTWVI